MVDLEETSGYVRPGRGQQVAKLHDIYDDDDDDDIMSSAKNNFSMQSSTWMKNIMAICSLVFQWLTCNLYLLYEFKLELEKLQAHSSVLRQKSQLYVQGLLNCQVNEMCIPS